MDMELAYKSTTTLAAIRAASPCESGWKKLLAAHGMPCALADDPDAITHLRALDVPAMTSQGVA